MGYRGLGRIELDLDRYGLRAGGASGARSAVASVARHGAKWRPAILLGGHQGVLGDRRLGAGTVTELGARIPWRLTGQEHPAQDRAKRTNVDLGARADGDLACDDLAHLGGEPTLLDRRVGRVAGRIDVFEPVHAAVVVDRYEPVRPGGSPRSRVPRFSGGSPRARPRAGRLAKG